MIRVRSYGNSGPTAIVVHGGPGAAGSMAPVARGLADSMRILEPFQSATAVTVAEHVAELDEVVQTRCADERPALVGHSWGAMLALAYAAAHPEMERAIVLICSGTFDQASRNRLNEIINERMTDELRYRFEHLKDEFPDENDRLHALGSLSLQLYSYDLESTEQEIEPGDKSAGAETWNDMLRLQKEGVYPAAFAAIKAPVLMIHGDHDPHPGAMIRASLIPYLPQLEYVEFERCGHYPWLEKSARAEFFRVIRDCLLRHTS